MNFGELSDLFINYTGAEGDVDSAQLASWFNEAQLDLAYDFTRAEELTLADSEIILPSNCLRIVDCSSSYSVLPTGKLMVDSIPAILYYTPIPEAFTGTNTMQESALPGAIHYLLAMFAASRYWDLESEGDAEESGHANKWMSYYLQGKAAAKSRLNTFGIKLDKWRVE